MTNTPNTNRIERSGHLRWLAVSDLVVDPQAQRKFRPEWSAEIAAEFDPDEFGIPLVSLRDGKHYVIDGQHRIGALRVMGWDDQQVQCWVYEGLTIPKEARRFLGHNKSKSVRAFDTFQIGVTAELPDERDIDRIVRLQGLKVAEGLPASVAAVGALRKVYAHGPAVLGRTLRIIRDAYGDDGMKGQIIEGVGLLCARYNGELDDERTVKRLQTAAGGLGALNTKAAAYRKTLGRPMPHCVAGAATDIINAGRGGKKLPAWWT